MDISYDYDYFTRAIGFGQVPQTPNEPAVTHPGNQLPFILDPDHPGNQLPFILDPDNRDNILVMRPATSRTHPYFASGFFSGDLTPEPWL